MSQNEADVPEWSEHQAKLLRRVAAGEPANEAPDWPNIIEGIESVGRSEFNAVQSLLVQALIRDLKCEAWPLAPYVPHWRAEARTFRRNARRRFTPTMRGRINVAELYSDALAGLPDTIDGMPPLPFPALTRLWTSWRAAPAPECIPC